MTEKLTSRNNPKIKAVGALLASSSERKRQSLFVTEGLRLCSDAAISGVEIKSSLISGSAVKKYGSQLRGIIDASEQVYEITDEIAAKISDTKSPQGVFSVCKMLDKSQNADTIICEGRYIALDNIQTPANLGAVCRTAEALGINGVIVGGGCDIYNPKALRASMGSLFREPVFCCDDLSLFLRELGEKGMSIIASVPDSSAVSVTDLKNKKGTVVVVGNEGNGVSDEILGVCDLKVTIPMEGRAESLNAAAAASILMWELMRK